MHEISNYLHQIISNAGHISNNEEMSEYAEKIESAAYKIDALVTDATITKKDIDIKKDSTKVVDFTKFFGLKVLLVDDVIENINIMKKIFTTLSCHLQSAMSGEEALEIYKGGYTPDIVCMDMIMPGIDGYTTTKELKSLGCEAYFIAISALKNQPHSVVSLFDCWLPKPFKLDHIVGALSGYKTSDATIKNSETYKLGTEISQEVKDELLQLAKEGAYSALNRLILSLEESTSKKFLLLSLKKVDFDSIIKSIVSP